MTDPLFDFDRALVDLCGHPPGLVQMVDYGPDSPFRWTWETPSDVDGVRHTFALSAVAYDGDDPMLARLWAWRVVAEDARRQAGRERSRWEFGEVLARASGIVLR